MVKKAASVANRNIALLRNLVSTENPLVGIEPSAILTFRDEYPDLANKSMAADAAKLGSNALLLEEFICREADKGRIRPDQFTTEPRRILLHGHCSRRRSLRLTALRKCSLYQ